MLAGANQLTEAFFQAKRDNQSIAAQLEGRSNAIWAWVMVAQAAANANQEADYRLALKETMRIADRPTIYAALETGLIRTAKSNDYPAWGMSIIKLAAINIGDKESANEFERLNDSIAAAKTAEKEEEAMLGLVTSELAEYQPKQECRPSFAA